MLTLYLIKVDELKIINGYGIEWYKIWEKLNKNEQRKWSATGPNDSILRSPLEKSFSLRTASVRNNPVVEKGTFKYLQHQ